MKAILSPLGDQIGPETSIGSFVSWRGSPPSIGRSQTCDEPPRLETKAIVLPSGLQRGWLLVPGAVVSRFGSPPADGNQPEAAVRLVRGPVELRDHVDDRLPVGRDLRVGDRLDGQQVVDRHRPAGGEERRGRQRRRAENGKSSRMVPILVNERNRTRAVGAQTPGMARLSGRKSSSSTNAITSARQRAEQPERRMVPLVQSRPITVSLLPMAVATNHPPIISPRIRDGATFETSDRPIGLSISSPSEITM